MKELFSRLSFIQINSGDLESIKSQVFRVKNICADFTSRPNLLSQIIQKIKENLSPHNLLTSIDIISHLADLSVRTKCLIIRSQIIDLMISKVFIWTLELASQIADITNCLTLCIESVCEMDFESKEIGLKFEVFDYISHAINLFCQIPFLFLISPQEYETLTGTLKISKYSFF